MTRLIPRVMLLLLPVLLLMASAAVVMGRILPGDVLVLVRNTTPRDLFLYDVPRRIPFNLTRDPMHELIPRWSPDGELIAYLAANTGEDFRLRVMTEHGEHPRWLGMGDFVSPRWLDDGSGLLGVQRNERNALDVFQMGLDGRVALADINAPETQTYAEQLNAVEYPAPDGMRTVYYDACGGWWCVFIREGETITPVYTFRHSEEPRFHEEIVWSPDGRYLAFTVIRVTENGRWDIYVIDAQAVQRRVALIPNSFAPDWQP